MNLLAGLFDTYPLIAGLFDAYPKASSTKRIAGLFNAYSLIEIGTTVAAVIVGPICMLFSDDFGQFSPIFGHLCGRNNNKCLVLLSWDKA